MRRCTHLSPIGFSSRAICRRKPRSDSKIESLFFLDFAKSFPEQAKVIREAATNSEVGFSFDRMVATENKMDVPRVYPTGPSVDVAVQYTYRMYAKCFQMPLCPEYTMLADRHAGFPYAHLGYPTKGEALKSELHAMLLEVRPDPVALSLPKGGEALTDEDLMDGKLRTVCCSPTFFVSWCKFYFENQNEALKRYYDTHWCKYGFVKQYGGFNRLMKSLEPFHWFFDSDVSGWDRRICLDDVYYMRVKGLKEYAADFGNELLTDGVLDWVVHNCVRPVVAFGDGTIWRRPTGNNSGANNTTTDNTVAHTVISFELVVRRFAELYMRYPEYEEVLEISNFLLFGDDNACGFAEHLFSSRDELQSYVIDHYSRYGLVIKAKAFHCFIGSPSGLSFLGSEAQYCRGVYVPVPRLGKIAYSISCDLLSSQKTISVLCDKVSAIWDLVSFTSMIEFKKAVQSFAVYVKHKYRQDMSDADVQKLVYATRGRVNWLLYMGYESQSKFNFFPRSRSVGGIKDFCYNMDDLVIPVKNDIPIGKAPRRIRQLINELLLSRSITPAGLKWLICATDPFHDEPISCDGYPDLTTSNVITQTLNLTTQITVPSSIPSGQPWDCHIFFLPCSPPLTFVPPGTGLGGTSPAFRLHAVTPSGGLVLNGSSSFLYSGVNTVSCPSGVDWISNPGSGATQPALAIPQSYCSGFFRLIGCGFEVVNTTAELYKGGTVTVYKSPSYASTCATDLGLTTFANAPPSTQSNAALYPTSRTWGAADGCYVVQSLNNSEVPFISSLPVKGAGLIVSLDVNALTNGSGSRLCFLPTSGAVVPGATAPMNDTFPFDISGAVFTGLHYNTTLQVTTRYILERIPSITEPDLLVLSRSPASDDPNVIELYQRVVSNLPVGVKVSDNPEGEWFLDVLDALAAAAPALGLALAPVTGPLGPAIGAIAGGVSGVTSNALRGGKGRPKNPHPKTDAKGSNAPSNNNKKKK